MGNNARSTHVENAERWNRFFEEQHAMLAFAAQTLLRHGPAEPVLSEACTMLQGSTPRENYRQAFAMRTVVKVAISQNLQNPAAEKVIEINRHPSRDDFENHQIANLPWPERAVYFLRNILRYSRRDTALLLRTSDSNIDQLLRLAEKRIGDAEATHRLRLKRLSVRIPQFMAETVPTNSFGKISAITTKQ